MTGSAMPMRFADRSGNIIDAYQAATQLTDESGQTYPMTIDTLIGNALGPAGYYGVFTANLHNDFTKSPYVEQAAVVASAKAAGVPVVSAKQMLTWLDGRNGSSFGSITWSGNVLDFTVSAGAGARNLYAMLPVNGPGSTTLSTLTVGGSPVAFTNHVIKGINYAFFPAAGGNYQATYVP
jgi:hypothetical protein